MKYRKIALIEAEQFDGSDEMMKKYNIEYFTTTFFKIKKSVFYKMKTLDGADYFTKGCWIATDTKGEHWAIRDDIFRQIYEPV